MITSISSIFPVVKELPSQDALLYAEQQPLWYSSRCKSVAVSDKALVQSIFQSQQDEGLHSEVRMPKKGKVAANDRWSRGRLAELSGSVRATNRKLLHGTSPLPSPPLLPKGTKK